MDSSESASSIIPKEATRCLRDGGILVELETYLEQRTGSDEVWVKRTCSACSKIYLSPVAVYPMKEKSTDPGKGTLRWK